ncbi:MAG: hypothetical protein HYX88_02110 [Chloroflexi bacterium]|nr:hypothetical protein [Chloroflexota bacterium]
MDKKTILRLVLRDVNSRYSGLKDMIIVPCHAVYVGHDPSHVALREYWIGRFPEERSLLAQHADAGVWEARENQDALLVFSGGQTEVSAGPIAEAQGYWLLEDQRKWLGQEEVRERSTTEEFARDSFENLRFPIYRFKQVTGAFPTKICVCGWKFKEGRFRIHALTIGLDLERFTYVPVNDPLGDPDDAATPLGKSMIGERSTLELYEKWPFGDSGELLEKRLKRDPFKRGNPYSF